MNTSDGERLVVSTSLQQATFRAAADRIIPEDDFPSASQAGVEPFVLRLMREELHEQFAGFVEGLDALNAEAIELYQRPFAELSADEQDLVLARAQSHPTASRREFFRRLVEWVSEGYYADPANGGNRDAASWRMIGYDPGIRTAPDRNKDE